MRRLKIATCLYGQPRLWEKAFQNFKNFTIRNRNILECDFFFHTWFSPDQVGQKYSTVAERYTEEELTIKENTITDLVRSFQPKHYQYDPPQTFDTSKIKNTLLFRGKDCPETYMSNFISQFESRKRLRNLFCDYCTKNNIEYDFVITSRMEFLKPFNIPFRRMDPTSVYVCPRHLPRKAIPDNFIVTGMKNYLEIFNLENSLFQVLDDKYILDEASKILGFQEPTQEYLIVLLLLNRKLFGKVIWDRYIPG